MVFVALAASITSQISSVLNQGVARSVSHMFGSGDAATLAAA